MLPFFVPEGKTMNLKEAAITIAIALFTLLVGFEAWQTKTLHGVSTAQAVEKVEREHILKSVDALTKADEKLTTIILQNTDTLSYIKGQLSGVPEDVAEVESKRYGL